MMEFLNQLTSGGATREDLQTLVRLMGPFAPHTGDEAWELLGNKGFLIETAWPTYDNALTEDATPTMAVVTPATAAPHAVIADELPIVSVVDGTTCSC